MTAMNVTWNILLFDPYGRNVHVQFTVRDVKGQTFNHLRADIWSRRPLIYRPDKPSNLLARD